jgi:outer membrane protein assembly factor BamB
MRFSGKRKVKKIQIKMKRGITSIVHAIILTETQDLQAGKPGTYYLKGVVVKGGIVYSMSGGDFGETHLFIYNNDSGFEDLGIVTKKLVNSAVLGDDGKIYAGEYSSSSAMLRLNDE